MAISYHHVFTLENKVSVSLQLYGLGIGYISLQCANVMLYGGLKAEAKPYITQATHK